MPAPRTKYHLSYFGYTLIEILVALTIIGVLFGFGYVSFRDFSRRQALAGIAKQLQGDLRLAQALSLAGQKPNDNKCNSPSFLSGIVVTFASGSYTTSYRCSGGDVSIKTVTLPVGEITLNPVPNPNFIEFKVLGQGTNLASGTQLSIRLVQQGTNQTATIVITPNGEIK